MDKGKFGQAQEVKQGIMETLTKQEKDAAKLLVKNLDIDFDCRNFENPSIQKFFSGLQALALKEEEPEEVEDLLEPNLEELKRFDTIMDRFRNTFFDGERQDPTSDINPAKGNKKPAKQGSAQSMDLAANNKKRKEVAGGARAKGQAKTAMDEADAEIPPSQAFGGRGRPVGLGGPNKRRKMDLVDFDDEPMPQFEEAPFGKEADPTKKRGRK